MIVLEKSSIGLQQMEQIEQFANGEVIPNQYLVVPSTRGLTQEQITKSEVVMGSYEGGFIKSDKKNIAIGKFPFV